MVGSVMPSCLPVHTIAACDFSNQKDLSIVPSV
jgi:hypothetical protein